MTNPTSTAVRPSRHLVVTAVLLMFASAAGGAGCSKATTTNGPAGTDERSNSAQPAAEGPRNAPARKAYGAPLDLKAPQVTLAEVLSTPSKYADKTVRLSGKITAVCQGMGCWLQLADGSGEKGAAHVKLRGHSFFVPKNAAGQSATVEGRVLPIPDEGHCEEEAKEQTGVVAKVELEASGVEIF